MKGFSRTGKNPHLRKQKVSFVQIKISVSIKSKTLVINKFPIA